MSTDMKLRWMSWLALLCWVVSIICVRFMDHQLTRAETIAAQCDQRLTACIAKGYVYQPVCR